MIIKLTDKNKEIILINTDHVVSVSKQGNGLNGIASKIILANVDRMEGTMFASETPEEIYNVITYKEMEFFEGSKHEVIINSPKENVEVKKK